MLITQYIWNLLHVFDQACNVLLGGDPRWTLSGRMGRDIAAGKCKLCRPICWLLGLIQPNHCAQAYIADQGVDPDSAQIAKE